MTSRRSSARLWGGHAHVGVVYPIDVRRSQSARRSAAPQVGERVDQSVFSPVVFPLGGCGSCDARPVVGVNGRARRRLHTLSGLLRQNPRRSVDRRHGSRWRPERSPAGCEGVRNDRDSNPRLGVRAVVRILVGGRRWSPAPAVLPVGKPTEMVLRWGCDGADGRQGESTSLSRGNDAVHWPNGLTGICPIIPPCSWQLALSHFNFSLMLWRKQQQQQIQTPSPLLMVNRSRNDVVSRLTLHQIYECTFRSCTFETDRSRTIEKPSKFHQNVVESEQVIKCQRHRNWWVTSVGLTVCPTCTYVHVHLFLDAPNI